jgi:CYTH domain-containing protein
MTTEIERKWIVTTMPSADTLGVGERLRQGYVARDGDVEVRVRASAATTVLTIKDGSGMSRTEVEVVITDQDVEALWPLTVGRRIEKVRYRVAVDAVTAEVDRYEGALGGLCTVEVEFASVDDARSFEPPTWFGKEVTGDPAWSNASLAAHGMPST